MVGCVRSDLVKMSVWNTRAYHLHKTVVVDDQLEEYGVFWHVIRYFTFCFVDI